MQLKAVMELQCIAELEYGPVWDVPKVTFPPVVELCQGLQEVLVPGLSCFRSHRQSLWHTPVMRLWCFSVSNILERYCNGSENLAV